METVKKINFSNLTKYVLLALSGTILLAISSKIKIPFYPVPMTMQTFVVMLIGVTLGFRLGLATIILYLFEGLEADAVFSGAPENGVGLIYFTGPTMGYLLGFIITASLSGLFSYDKNILKNFFKLAFATSFIYILGIIWLGILIGWEKPVFSLGAKPFLLAELFKIFLVTILVTKVRNIKKII